MEEELLNILSKRGRSSNTRNVVIYPIEGEMVHIDPQLLFQCIIIAANTTNDIEGIFEHELSIHPPALFDSHLLMREPQKSVLADAIWEKVSSGFTPPKVKSVMY